VDRFDVIIIGMGVGGEAAAGRLLAAGRRVAVIERELIGGECAYWACIPSNTLLCGPEVRAGASRVAGVATPAIHWPGLAGELVRAVAVAGFLRDGPAAGVGEGLGGGWLVHRKAIAGCL
jgi:pyruvate/2-oxoglutarate dehydrogenase complex dihydrolipoamide dehydrogenase (E3) component